MTDKELRELEKRVEDRVLRRLLKITDKLSDRVNYGPIIDLHNALIDEIDKG